MVIGVVAFMYVCWGISWFLYRNNVLATARAFYYCSASYACCLPQAGQEVGKALALDYLPPPAEAAAVPWLPRPLDRWAVPLARSLALRTSAEPANPEEEALVGGGGGGRRGRERTCKESLLKRRPCWWHS